MDRETITAESLLRDIYEAESALRWFEQKYGLLSETFYRVYQQGQLRDEDPDEDYERIILTVLQDKSAQVYRYWYNGVPYVTVVAAVHTQQ